jgi:hypothetical protein
VERLLANRNFDRCGVTLRYEKNEAINNKITKQQNQERIDQIINKQHKNAKQ